MRNSAFWIQICTVFIYEKIWRSFWEEKRKRLPIFIALLKEIRGKGEIKLKMGNLRKIGEFL